MASGYSIFNPQPHPLAVVVVVLGLAGTEESPYFVDLVHGLDKRCIIIGVRGYETGIDTPHDTKLFLKNDMSRVERVAIWVKSMYPSTPLIGVGVSLGASLLLRYHVLSVQSVFNRIVLVSMSVWYEHGVSTMSNTWKGWLVSKLLVWWQFERLFWTKNYLTTVKRPTMCQWLRLLFATNLLVQDKILCDELYGMPLNDYLKSTDLRWATKSERCRNVHFLLSENDCMLSPAHQSLTRDVLLESTFSAANIVKIGDHGEFTKEEKERKRNDYLVEYCSKVIAFARV